MKNLAKRRRLKTANRRLKTINHLFATILIVFSVTLLFAASSAWAQEPPVPFQTVLSPSGTAWEVDGVGDPFILKENGTYKMWYRGNSFWWEGRWFVNDGTIGYAESTDGVNWTNRQLVHSNGNVLTDYLFTSSPWVIKEGSTYRMWHSDYYVWVGGDWSFYISHLTSTNGINWSNEQEVLRGSGNFSNNDDYNTGNQSVIREADGTYSMWYQVAQRPSVNVGGPSNIVRATSTNGINWTNRQLVLPRIPGGPEASVGSPDVVRNADGTYTMYYVANGSIGWAWGEAIYRAQSIDGITWTNRQQILSRNQLASDILTLDQPHYFRDTDGTEYLYFSFNRPVAGSSTGYREYIGRALLNNITPPSPYIPPSYTPPNLDFGDAPDQPVENFPSLLARNGARHSGPTNFYFGWGVDWEADSRQVDLDIPFDDGLLWRTPITFYVENQSGSAKYVNVLVDYNGNGVWDPGEWVAPQNLVVVGSGYYSVQADLPDDTWMRMTITDIPLTDYVGSWPNVFMGGETEDYIMHRGEPHSPPPGVPGQPPHDGPPTGVNTYWLAALALLAMAMGLVVIKRAKFLRA